MEHTSQVETWVVVADNCQAKIFHILKFPKIEQVFYLEHPESRFHNRDLVSSKPGSSSQVGGTIRYSYQPETEPRHLEAVKFAVYLSDYLEKAKRESKFQRLYLIATPSFLGLLRHHLSAETQKVVIAESPKELTNCNSETIEEHLVDLRP